MPRRGTRALELATRIGDGTLSGVRRLFEEKLSLVLQAASAGILTASAVLVRRVTAAVFDDVWAGRAAALLFMACAPIAVLTLQGTDVGLVCLLLLLGVTNRLNWYSAGSGPAWRPWPGRSGIALVT